jgi:hypothetical protein
MFHFFSVRPFQFSRREWIGFTGRIDEIDSADRMLAECWPSARR